MKELTDNQIKALAGLIVLGTSGGSFFLGYKVSQKRLRAYYEEIAEKEIAQAKRFYADLNEEAPDPEDMLRTLHPESVRINPVQEEQKLREQEGYRERLRELKYHAASTDEAKKDEEVVEEAVEEIEEAVEEIKNVFDQPVDESEALVWDYEWEIANRKEGIPYIIHHDEFYENDDNYEQVSLTYFDGDGTLVDSRDQMVDDVDKTIGINNMMMFGKGSKDRNVVYIRNEALENDFEIVRHEGSFGEVVHDIRHSDDTMMRTPRRRRRLED